MEDKAGLLQVNKNKRCLPTPDNKEPQSCKVRLMERDTEPVSPEPLPAAQLLHQHAVAPSSSNELPEDKIDSSMSCSADPTPESYQGYLHTKNHFHEHKELDLKDSNYTDHSPSNIDHSPSNIDHCSSNTHSQLEEKNTSLQFSPQKQQGDTPHHLRQVDTSQSLRQVDTPQSLRQVDTPQSLRQVDTPRSLRQVDTPQSLRQVDAPQHLKQVDTPQSLLQVDTPQSLRQGDTPHHLRQVDAPQSLRQVDTPQSLRQVDTPQHLQQVDSPQELKQVDTPQQLKQVDPPQSLRQVDTSQHLQQVDTPEHLQNVDPPLVYSHSSRQEESVSSVKEKTNPNIVCSHNSDEDFSPSSYCQNILQLPHSILLYIFQFLTIPERLCCVALVCTKWYELSKDPSLWRSISFQDLTHMCITDEILDKVTSYSNHVVHLDLSNIMGFSLHGIASLLKKCRHLVFLSLKGCCCLPDSTFRLIGQNLPDLEQLYLDDCFAVSNETMIEIFIRCSKLTHVSVSSQLSSVTVLTLAHFCPQLKLLNISHCEAVDALAKLFQKCQQLESLNISNCPLTDEHLMYLSKLSHLKHIYLNSVNMSSKAAKEIVKNCSQLQTISLSFNDCVDDDCIETVARYARNLKVLKCIRCNITDQGLMAIGQNCENLQKLDVSFCNQISNEGVNFVSTKCSKLHFLGLFSCENVETDFLIELEKNYPQILFYCFNLEYNRLIKKATEQGYL